MWITTAAGMCVVRSQAIGWFDMVLYSWDETPDVRIEQAEVRAHMVSGETVGLVQVHGGTEQGQAFIRALGQAEAGGQVFFDVCDWLYEQKKKGGGESEQA